MALDPFDAGPDPGSELGSDPGPDRGPESGSDLGPESGPDPGPELKTRDLRGFQRKIVRGVVGRDGQLRKFRIYQKCFGFGSIPNRKFDSSGKIGD